MIDITVSSLVKSFEIGNNILDGLSFQVEAGERVGILGPNGCGKTTLFRILTGALDYDEGQVSIAPSKRIGLISQFPVYPEGWTTSTPFAGRWSASPSAWSTTAPPPCSRSTTGWRQTLSVSAAMRPTLP